MNLELLCGGKGGLMSCGLRGSVAGMRRKGVLSIWGVESGCSDEKEGENEW